MTDADVIVLGGGIAGAATAENLARQGVSTLLIEQFEPGHTRGSSHGDGRIVRYAYTRAIYAEMMTLAYPLWDALAERAGEPLIQRTGGLDIGLQETASLGHIEENFRRFEIPYESLSGAEAAERFPQYQFGAGARVLFQQDSSVGFASKAVLALWRLAQAAGAQVITGERVSAIRPFTDRVEVIGESGTVWTGRKLVITAGGWARMLLGSLGVHLPLRVSQEQVGYFAPEGPVNHTVGTMPIFIDHHADRYGLPVVDIPGVKIGFDGSGPSINPDRRVPANEASIRLMQTYIDERFPHLARSPIEVITCLYTSTPDSDFIYDRLPGYSNVIVGSACSGHGFKFGPLHGVILASLALDTTPPVSLDAFRITRFL